MDITTCTCMIIHHTNSSYDFKLDDDDDEVDDDDDDNRYAND